MNTQVRLSLLAIATLALVAAPAFADEIDEAREQAARLGSARVIVEFNAGAIPEGLLSRRAEVLAQRERIARTGEGLLGRVSASHKKSTWRFQYLPLVAAEVTPEGLEELAAAPETTSVWIDRPQPPLLAESVPLIGGDMAHQQGFEGTGFAVAVLDTGVDGTHPFLAGRIVAEACFGTTSGAQNTTSLCPGGAQSSTAPGSGGPCPIDGCSHGTHVAGIAAGSGAAFDGVAPNAGIIAVQVFSQFTGEQNCGQGVSTCLSAFTSDTIKGLEYVYSKRSVFNIGSVNMSLGAGKYANVCDEGSYKLAIDMLRAEGIATVVASGNEGYSDGISSPACISSAIAVGSTTKEDGVSVFSNSNALIDLLAPGSAINSSVPGGGFESFDGTSMATPHVAGAFAVLRQKAPTASVNELLAALKNTGLGVTDPSNQITRPRIRLDLALAQVGGPTTTGVLTVTPAAGLAASGLVGGPFSPLSVVYTLQNTGGQDLNFSIQGSAAWIQLSTPGGTLAPDAMQNVTVSLGMAANSLPAGLSTGSVSFQNTTNGDGNTSRAVSLTVQGAGVANDKFTNAFLLSTDAGTTLSSSVGATKEPGEPSHAGNTGGASLWWRWVAPSNGSLSVDTAGSAFDTLLGVYTGNSVNALTQQAANDNAAGGGLQSALEFTVSQGAHYWIALDGKAGATGDTRLNWLFRGDLGGFGGLTVSPEAGFLSTGPPGGPFSPTQRVYTLTNTEASTLNYSVSSSAAFVDVSSAGGSLSPGQSTQLTVSLNAAANALPPGLNAGLLQIGGLERDIQLAVTSGGLTNDFFLSPTALSGVNVNTGGSNIDATSEPGEPFHGDNVGGASVWWSWTAPASGLASVSTAGSNFDTTLGVYTGGAVDALTTVSSNDDADGTLQSRVTFQVVGGQTYAIAVDGYNGDSGSISLAIVSGVAAVSGDRFGQPQGLADLNTPLFSTNEGATREAGEPEHAGNPGGASVWFEWTAAGTGIVTVDTFNSTFDTLLAVYSGTGLGSLALIGENDDFDSGAGDFSSVVSFQAIAGETYRFAVDGWGGDQGDLTLSFFATDFPNIVESFEGSNLLGNWSTPPFADADWGFTDQTAFEGNSSFVSSDLISDGEIASLEFTGEFVEGSLRFAVQVSSEENFDFFFFEVDDEELFFGSGEIPFSRTDLVGFDIPISAGTHTLRWSYEKDVSFSAGFDGAWIDSIEFIPIPEPAPGAGSAAALLTLAALARRGLRTRP